MARKSRVYTEAYLGTPHKETRRLTQPGRKRALSGWKLSKAGKDFRYKRPREGAGVRRNMGESFVLLACSAVSRETSIPKTVIRNVDPAENQDCSQDQ